jgi:hypothetical protein
MLQNSRIYYSARSYNDSLGRLVRQDPIGIAAGDARLYDSFSGAI